MKRIRAIHVPAFIVGIAAFQAGCLRTPPAKVSRPLTDWVVPAPVLEATPPDSNGHPTTSLVIIDSVALKAIEVGWGSGAIVVTTFQGGRYHPETVRALANDSAVLDRFAETLIHEVGQGRRVILDIKAATPDDVQELASVARAIGRLSGNTGARSLSLMVPAQDTVSYPTLVLARLADMLIVRLEGEHRAGTPPGPPVTPEFINRVIGMRTRLIGASRVAVEIPLYGYLWDRNGNARPVTFQEAQSHVQRESGVLTRDPPSQFLTASGRDGWTLWVPDARTVRFIVDMAKRRGITEFFLAGPAGADVPALRTAN